MADPTFHSATGVTGASVSSLATPAMSTTSGRFLVFLVDKYQASTTITGVSDTASNAYTRAGSSQGVDASNTHEIWYTASPITGNGSNVVTVTFSGSVGDAIISVAEFSLSGATGMSYDAEATIKTTSDGTSHVSNSLTTGGADALVVGGFVYWSNPREINDGTNGIVMWESGSGGIDNGAFAYRTTDAAGSYTIDVVTTDATELIASAKSFTFTTGGASVVPQAMAQYINQVIS